MADFSVDTNIHGGPIDPVTGSVLADETSELNGLDKMLLTSKAPPTAARCDRCSGKDKR